MVIKNPVHTLPTLSLALSGYGEDLVRMEKRLGCAARGASVNVQWVVHKIDPSSSAVCPQGPFISFKGQPVFTGLVTTEVLQAWLKEAAYPKAAAAD